MARVFAILGVLGLVVSAVITHEAVTTALLGAGLTGLPFARRLAKEMRKAA